MKPARGALILASLTLMLGTAPLMAADTKTTPSPAKGVPEAISLPKYTPPDAYSEDIAVSSQGKNFVIHRFVDHGKLRTEMTMDGKSFVMIETGDDQGTTYTVMPDMKMVMKQTSRTTEDAMAMSGHADKDKAKAHLEKESKERAGSTSTSVPAASPNGAPPANMNVEDLGQETVNGVAAKKFRMSSPDGSAVGWFDPASGAPIRMESIVNGDKQSLEWKNRKSGAQSADLFQVPKDYKVQDVDAMMAQMKAAQAQAGGNMMSAMAGGMAQGMGSSVGSSLGSSLGGAIGGPLGAMAGNYIGGKIGGFLGRKAASAL